MRGGRLLLGFVVLHQQAGHRGAERFLAGLQGEADPGARFGFLSGLRRARRCGPGRPRTGRRSRSDSCAVPGIAVERRDARPRAPGHLRGRCGCGGIGRARRSADKARCHPACRAWRGRASSGCSGCAAAAANRRGCGRCAGLQALQAAELHDRVARIEGHRGQRDGKSRQQTECGGSRWGHFRYSDGKPIMVGELLSQTGGRRVLNRFGDFDRFNEQTAP